MEVREDLDLYVIARETHSDIDEVMAWPLGKIARWRTALQLMAEEMRKAVQTQAGTRAAPAAPKTPSSGTIYALEGDKIVKRRL